MTDRLKGKVAIVTGSGQGVGRSTAMLLAKEGAKVITNNRKAGSRRGDAETVAKEIKEAGGQALPFLGDVSDFEVAGKLIQTAIDAFGRIDILVNNAGTVVSKPIWELSEEDWDIVVDSHLKGTYNCTRHVAPLMKEQKWGRIINCTSDCWRGTPGVANYGAAKGGIVSFSKCVALDLGEFGVTCNVYHPFAMTRLQRGGPVIEQMFKKRLELGLITEEEYKWQINPPPPEGVASLIAYLATEAAANINGKVFYASGSRVGIYSDPVREKTMTREEGLWSVEELITKVPQVLLPKK